MSRKAAAVVALALGVVGSVQGVACADTTAGPSTGMGGSPVAVDAEQQGLLIINGPVVDARCAAPWSNGAVLGGILAPNSHYAACDTAPVNQSQNAPYHGGLLF